MLQRFLRKIRFTTRYPDLAFSVADRKDLWLFGLFRNRLLSKKAAARLTSTNSLQIRPSLTKTKGQRVLVNLDCSPQIDCFDELFIDNIYNLSIVSFTPDLVVDCGGFCGYFSTLAAGWFPKVRIICFEANSENLPMLRQQLDILTSSVELHHAAVFTQNGTITFAGSGLGGFIKTGSSPGIHCNVPCIDFPEWLEKQAPKKLVWKLDVEGAELEILPATLPHLPQLCVCYLETHHDDMVCAKLLDPFRDAGFSVCEIRRRPAEGFDYVEWVLTRQ